MRYAPSSQSLQQTLKQLETAYKRFYDGLGSYPKRKKISRPFGIKFPQGFSFEDHSNPRKGYIRLPKIGRLRYFKSRDLEGQIRSVTLRREGSDYFISVLCDVADKYDGVVNPSISNVGIDRGIAHTLVVSDGNFHDLDLEKIKKIEVTIAGEQQKLSRKKRFSKNWFKTKLKIDRLHKKATHIRHDFAWKQAREIAKNHSVIALEDLNVRNMSKSASGTIENPGRKVAQKSGLNRSILRMGWYDFAKKLEWQAKKHGSRVIYCNPRYFTSSVQRSNWMLTGRSTDLR
ncbi:MAG: RNA-guided endonuclease InsQ/TnpB family protein [Oligoflexus sp.]